MKEQERLKLKTNKAMNMDKIENQKEIKQNVKSRNKNDKETKIKSKISKIATWNIKTMLAPGKMMEVARELTKYGISIAALQEIRWGGQGEINKKDFKMLYSGEKKQGHKGTAFIIDKKLKIMAFKPINGRLCYVRIEGKPLNLSIICAYAPTEVDDQEVKDKFYDDLETEYEKTPKQDILIILGDMNAQIGKENYIKEVAGLQTIHDKTNDNGNRICNFAAKTNMVISSTKHKHRRIHKETWMPPGATRGTQIDHILIKKKHSKIITDVRSYRGANADTDHMLVIAKVKQEYESKQRRRESKRRNIEKLYTENGRKEYIKEINKEMERYENKADIECEWKELKEVVEKACDKTIGFKERTMRKQWYDDECQEKTNKKNKARIKWISTKKEEDLQQYKENKAESQRTCRQKRNEWIEKMMEEIEDNYKNNNTKKFYKQIKNQKMGNTIRNRGLKDERGFIEYDENKKKEIWRKYFHKLLYEANEENNEYGQERESEEAAEEEEEVEEPTFEETIEAIKKIKNGKAPGHDELNGELMKYGGEKLQVTIYSLIKEIWRKEQMPTEWEMGVIVTIAKKGDLQQCSNHRGITLLNSAYKVLTSILQRKLMRYAEREIGDYQMGFRPGRSTVDALHVMLQILEKSHEHDLELHMIFVDYRQAFDNINRKKLMQTLKDVGIPGKLRNCIQMTLNNSKAIVKTEEGYTESFRINKGVRQGDALSATLFNLAMEGTIRRLKVHGNIKTREAQILAYADDIVIISRSLKKMTEIFKKLIKESKMIGLEINESKTKYMKCKRGKDDTRKVVKIENYELEKVKDFNYLGIQISHNNERKEEIRERIQKGYKAFYANRETLKSKKLKVQTRIRIYKTLIRPVVLYAAEIMCPTQAEKEQLRIFERKVLRSIMGLKSIDNDLKRQYMNHEITEIMKGEDIVKVMSAQRIRWLGHITRKSEQSILKEIMTWKPEKNRPRGRPRMRWYDEVTEDLRKMEIEDWKKKASNRVEWRGIVEKTKTHRKL